MVPLIYLFAISQRGKKTASLMAMFVVHSATGAGLEPYPPPWSYNTDRFKLPVFLNPLGLSFSNSRLRTRRMHSSHRLGLASACPPPGHAKSRQGLQLAVSQLDVSGADHTRFEAKGRTDVLVDAGAGVVAHDEVVAVCVLHLVDRDGAR